MKYTKELLEEAVKNSLNVTQVLEKLGLKMAGGTHTYISKKIKELNINTDHFLGVRSNLGKAPKNKHTKESFLKILEKRSCLNGTRLLRLLKRFEIKEHRCEICRRDTWNEKEIPLEVDHIDGDHFNNNLTNLRVICPNCHAQTETYCSKNKGR